MIYKNTVRVVLSEEATEQYNELKNLALEEKTKTFHFALLCAIERCKENLRNNPFYGIRIPKKYISKKLEEKFKTNKLWKVNLSGYWRLIYTLKGDKVEVIAFILTITDHKTYNKIFGYKKK